MSQCSCPNKQNGYLCNVNRIAVPCGKAEKYMAFVEKLNQYLIKKYGKVYVGLQLYEDKVACNVFTIVAVYRDVPCINKIMVAISAEIIQIYAKVWGSCIRRETLFSFIGSNKIVLGDQCK